MSDFQKRVQKIVDEQGSWYERKLDDGMMSSDLYPYDSMFSPIKVGGITIKNRLVMGPMGNVNMADETGKPSKKMIEYFTSRAKGGVGLITSGLIPVSHGIDPTVTEPNDLSYFPRIDASRTRYAGWRDLSEQCHAYGAKFFIQLTPGLGRVGSPECLMTKHRLPVSASTNPNFYIPEIPCKKLSDRKAARIIKNAAQAACDAKAATIDGVYLHGHEGYLLEQMSNPAFNRRHGRYGDYERFGLDLVREIRERVGAKYPIMYRIDLSLVLKETYGNKIGSIKSLKKFKNERTVDQSLQYMKHLVEAGVDIFDVDLGCYDNWWYPHPSSGMAPGCYLDVSKIVKEYFRDNGVKSNLGLDVPVVAVGKLGYPDLAERALRQNQCDMIMLARPLLADPEWPNKAFSGRVDDIRPCIGDQEGCINEFVEGGHIQCAVNPITGFEDVFNGSELSKVDMPKKVAVVGGGPSGIMCALVLAKRGHEVSLFEKGSELGGMMIPGSVPKIKFDMVNYREYLIRQIEKTKNITLSLNCEVTEQMLEDGDFDSAVIACGTTAVIPPIEGAKDRDDVRTAIDLLNNPAIIGENKKVVIVGGGDVGCETAYYLSQEKKCDVCIVEMLPNLMSGTCTANRGYLLYNLNRAGVTVHNCTEVLKIEDDRVLVSKNYGKNVPDPFNSWNPLLPENIKNPLAKKIQDDCRPLEIEFDHVLFAAGVKKNDSLYFKLQRGAKIKDLHNIGDSCNLGRIFEAIKSAYHVGTLI